MYKSTLVYKSCISRVGATEYAIVVPNHFCSNMAFVYGPDYRRLITLALNQNTEKKMGTQN